MALQVPSLGSPRNQGEASDFVGLSSGHLVGQPDSGVPIECLLGNAHMPAALREQDQYYEAGFVGGTT